MEVIVAHDKYGTFTYKSALDLLVQRVQEGYWYYDEDAVEAADIAKYGSEEKAWRFLHSRRDHEYEYVEKQVVR